MLKIILALLASIGVALFAISGINSTIDTDGRFTSGIPKKTADRADDYAKKLFASQGGLVAVGDERLIKRALVLAEAGDCHVIGSSRAMTIQAKAIRLVAPECRQPVNLGVSGGSFEDILIYAHLAITHQSKHLFINIDHWTFQPGADDRFYELGEEYCNAVRFFSLQRADCAVQPERGKLLDPTYALKNLRSSPSAPVKAYRVMPAEPRNNHEAATLTDGSHEYSLEYRQKMLRTWDARHLSYKLLPGPPSEAALEDFRKLLKKASSSGVSVSFVLAPYHPRVFECEVPAMCLALQTTQAASTALAEQAGAKLYGSYKVPGVGTEDFMSDMFLFPAAFERVLAFSQGKNPSRP
ncbi:hypothetical protein [Polaromonas sp. LjRoot131]|uniref:hypothetical protein n=1 Tax=Polaromonas sp. LjRoot131 TaxID=3342262 RepID=UPI003ECE93EC